MSYNKHIFFYMTTICVHWGSKWKKNFFKNPKLICYQFCFFFVFVPKGLKIQSMHPLTCYFLSTSSTEKLSFVKNFGGEFTTNRYICYFAVCMLVLINNILWDIFKRILLSSVIGILGWKVYFTMELQSEGV